MAQSDNVHISVVIPCYNGEESILRCVSSALNQDYESLEVIAIDDSSTDRTGELLSSIVTERSLTVVKHAMNRGLAATYNHGLELAKGGFVLFLQQDCQPASRDWLTRALNHFTSPEIAVVTGRPVFDLEKFGLIPKAFIFLRKIHSFIDENLLIEELPFSEGKCDLFRKDVAQQIGGFPADKLRTSGEDQWISYAIRRQGYRIIRDNSLSFRQELATGLGDNLTKEFLYGKTQAGITREYGTYPLKNLDKSSNARVRVVNKLSKLLVASLILSCLVSGLILGASALLVLSGVLAFTRLFFFSVTSLRYVIRFTIVESLVVAGIGVVTDFIYFSAFIYGLFLSVLGRRL